MKKLLLLYILFFNIIAFAQQYALGPYGAPGNICGLAIKDNYLYFGMSGAGDSTNNAVYKINMVYGPTQTKILVVGNLGPIEDLLFNGNDLYIGQYWSNSIKKVDVSQTNPTLTNVVSSGIFAPTGMAVYNNYLYFCEGYGQKISRISLSLTNPVVETVFGYATADYCNPWNMQLYSNELYISESITGKITKLNLLDPNPVPIDVVTNLTSPYCMMQKGNFLYFENNIPNNAKILAIDLTTTNPVVETLNLPNWNAFGLRTRWVISSNNILYKSAWQGSIFKYDLNNLGLGNAEHERRLEISPNPASDYITFKNLEKEENLQVINSLGQIIKTQRINIAGVLNVADLESGLYFIKTDDGASYRFIKN